MSGKKKNTEIHKTRSTSQPRNSQHSSPPRRWWHEILDTNKVIAVGTVGLFLVGVVTVCVMVDQYDKEHRPHVIFSRPIELVDPLVCDPTAAQVTAHLKVSIKNIGIEGADRAVAMPSLHLIGDTPDSGQEIEKLIDLSKGGCLGKLAKNASVGIPLR